MIRQGVINSVSELDDKFYEAIRYALKFILLMDSDKRPLLVERQFKKGNERKEKQIFGKLNQQRISLTTAYRNTMNAYNVDDTIVLDKEGKALRGIIVRGFLRRQHYGPGNSFVKTIYIDAHESHSWMREGIRIVHVEK